MYKIYCLINEDDSKRKRIVYSPDAGPHGPIATSAILNLEVNSAGSLSMTIPLINRNRGYIDAFKNTIIVEENGKEIWRGRPISSDHDIYSTRTIVCEGELAFLNDVLLPDYDYTWNGEGEEGVNDGSKNSDRRVSVETFITTCLNVYNKIASDNRKINLGHIDDNLKDRLVNAKSTKYDSIYNQLMVNTVDTFGGMLYLSHYDETDKFSDTPTLNYYEEAAGKNIQNVETTVNLLDYSAHNERVDFATVIFPFGEKEVEVTSETTTEEIEPLTDNSALQDLLDEVLKKLELAVPGSDEYNELLKQKEELEAQLSAGGTISTTTVTKEKVVVDISSVNAQNPGEKYITAGEEAINQFGVIQRAVYCSYATPIEVFNFGVLELSKALRSVTEHEVSALDLHIVDKAQNPLEVGKKVEVWFKKTISEYRIESASIDLLNPSSTTYTLKDTNITPYTIVRTDKPKDMPYMQNIFGLFEKQFVRGEWYNYIKTFNGKTMPNAQISNLFSKPDSNGLRVFGYQVDLEALYNETGMEEFTEPNPTIVNFDVNEYPYTIFMVIDLDLNVLKLDYENESSSYCFDVDFGPIYSGTTISSANLVAKRTSDKTSHKIRSNWVEGIISYGTYNFNGNASLDPNIITQVYAIETKKPGNQTKSCMIYSLNQSIYDAVIGWDPIDSSIGFCRSWGTRTVGVDAGYNSLESYSLSERTTNPKVDEAIYSTGGFSMNLHRSENIERRVSSMSEIEKVLSNGYTHGIIRYLALSNTSYSQEKIKANLEFLREQYTKEE